MAQRSQHELEPVPDAGEHPIIMLEGTFLWSTEASDIRCGGCKKIILPGYSPRGLRAAIGGPRPEIRGPYFFACGCGATLRFIAPA